uniref:Putative long-chain-fatty-acid--CoA ligase n=1 Tax=Paulinella chromatophora TaxID=39717 RepID=B1X5B6_PAUCH|nr:putative long-chain-fatty-acid--CoA ligase [Paulinella chromatophora]ACB43135.1 putative long-chain-fatty-acid--CoA ligase [Paulinella chromatophora]
MRNLKDDIKTGGSFVVKQAFVSWDGDLKDQSYLARQTDWKSLESIDQLWPMLSKDYGDNLALVSPHTYKSEKLSYSQLSERIEQASAAFIRFGIKDGDVVTLFAENSPRWLVIDQGLMRAGAADAVRGIAAPSEELEFIIKDSGSIALIVQSANILKHLELEASLLFVLILEGEAPSNTIGWEEFISYGAKTQALPSFYNDSRRLATLIYTSGTTSKPKGVALTHSNLLHQIRTLRVVVEPHSNENTLSILPIWHAYERSIEYFLLSCGCCQNYTNLKKLRKDLQHIKPIYLVSVPRLWQALMEGFEDNLSNLPSHVNYLIRVFLKLSRYNRSRWRFAQNLSIQPVCNKARFLAGIEVLITWPSHVLASITIWPKVRQQLVGDLLTTAICGGGALGAYIDSFFEAIGIELLVGYGLTETSPVLTCRRRSANIRESAGRPLPLTDLRIIDSSSARPLGWGEKGRILARGPQVMKGYYRESDSNMTILNGESWFDTGDLGYLLPDGSLILTGRAKETIVLNNGENIEPVVLEVTLSASPLVEQIILIGQDQRQLAALIVPCFEAIGNLMQVRNILNNDLPLIMNAIKEELNRILAGRIGSRLNERLAGIALVEPFSIENGLLTQTLKQRRNEIAIYNKKIIDTIYSY